jgi:hypothetical protein
LAPKQLKANHAYAFREKVEATKRKVTKEWALAKIDANVFEPPLSSAQNCIGEITSWWRPIVLEYVENLSAIANSHVWDVLKEAHNVPKSLCSVISEEWTTECYKLTSILKEVFEARLQKEVPWGTVSPYLTSRLECEGVLPDALIEDIVGSAKRRRTSSSDSTQDYFSGFMRSIATTAADGGDTTETVSDRALRNELRAARERWNDNKKVHDVFSAIEIVWAVEHKKFIEYVFEETKENLLNSRCHWVTTKMFDNIRIRDAAAEDPLQQQRRQQLKKTKDRMEKCMNELQAMRSNV